MLKEYFLKYAAVISQVPGTHTQMRNLIVGSRVIPSLLKEVGFLLLRHTVYGRPALAVCAYGVCVLVSISGVIGQAILKLNLAQKMQFLPLLTALINRPPQRAKSIILLTIICI